MPAHHQHPRRIPARKPGDDVHDVDRRTLRVTADLHHRWVVLDAETSTARGAVSLQLVEQIPARRADSPSVAQRVAHRVARPERNED